MWGACFLSSETALGTSRGGVPSAEILCWSSWMILWVVIKGEKKAFKSLLCIKFIWQLELLRGEKLCFTCSPVCVSWAHHLPACTFLLQQWNQEWGLQVLLFHFSSWAVPAQRDPCASLEEMVLCLTQSLLWPAFYQEWWEINPLCTWQLL